MTDTDDWLTQHHAELDAADWHNIPEGRYAIPVYDESHDDPDHPDFYRLLGHKIYNRTVSKTDSKGRTYGHDYFHRRTELADDVEWSAFRSQLDSQGHQGADRAQKADILELLKYPEEYRKNFARVSGWQDTGATVPEGHWVKRAKAIREAAEADDMDDALLYLDLALDMTRTLGWWPAQSIAAGVGEAADKVWYDASKDTVCWFSEKEPCKGVRPVDVPDPECVELFAELDWEQSVLLAAWFRSDENLCMVRDDMFAAPKQQLPVASGPVPEGEQPVLEADEGALF